MEKTRHCSSPVQYSPNSEAWWWQHHAVGVFFSCRNRTTGCNRGKDECGQVQGHPGRKPRSCGFTTTPWLFLNGPARAQLRLKPNWASLERPKNGCPPTFTIQPDRTGEDLQGGMAEDPQIQVWKTCCIFPKKTHGCIKSKGCSTKYWAKGLNT